MENLNLVLPEIFISLSIMFLLILGVFKKDSSKIIFNLSLFAILLGLSSLMHADKGFITVDGKNIEMDVERQYQAPASYPRKALRLAKEGYVIVEFDVSADGDVIDPFVLEGEPAGLFDRAAMKSIRKWIYQPPVYEGVPVQVNDVQVKLSFRVQ